MNNLKKFETEAEYQAWKDGDDYVFPNICKVGEEVVYNNYPDPFWIEALEDVTVRFTNNWQNTSFVGEWSFDKTTWTKFSSEVTVRIGQKLYFRYTKNTGERRLWVSGKYNVGGSILSLVYGADYLMYDTHSINIFYYLFSEAKKVVNAKYLVLATKMQSSASNIEGMYYNLFSGCSLLETPPRLPRTPLGSCCYANMFFGCSSLKKAPSMLATTSDTSSNRWGYYNEMFRGCSKLSYIKMLFPSGAFQNNDTTSDWTRYWVSGVASTGTFIASSKRTSFTRGVHGIPEGWDLYLYDEDNDRYVVKFKVNGIPYEFYTNEPRDVRWSDFINSVHNTNGFTNNHNYDIVYGSDFVLYGGNKVSYSEKIILNASYTIGQPTSTAEE